MKYQLLQLLQPHETFKAHGILSFHLNHSEHEGFQVSMHANSILHVKNIAALQSRVQLNKTTDGNIRLIRYSQLSITISPFREFIFLHSFMLCALFNA